MILMVASVMYQAFLLLLPSLKLRKIGEGKILKVITGWPHIQEERIQLDIVINGAVQHDPVFLCAYEMVNVVF